MSKAAYVGVSAKARKVKKMYVGVNGVARKVKKAYIGVNGVAHLCWQGINANPVLEENDWATIQEVAAAGEAANFWSIGDTKTVTLNGTDYIFRIIGFDHDNLNSADTMYGNSGYNGGKNKAAITFEMSAVFGTNYYMNSSNTNSGGWDGSYMRSTVMPTMKGYMPTALKNALRTVSKLASAGDKSSTIKFSADQLFLLSEIEVNGTTSYSFAGEGTQYSYYKAGNSKVKKIGSDNKPWWLRSPQSAANSGFVAVYTSGSLGNVYAKTSYGVSFAFCI